MTVTRTSVRLAVPHAMLVIPQLLIDKLFDPLSSSYLFVVSVRVTLRSRSGRHDRVDTNRLIRYVY